MNGTNAASRWAFLATVALGLLASRRADADCTWYPGYIYPSTTGEIQMWDGSPGLVNDIILLGGGQHTHESLCVDGNAKWSGRCTTIGEQAAWVTPDDIQAQRDTLHCSLKHPTDLLTAFGPGHYIDKGGTRRSGADVYPYRTGTGFYNVNASTRDLMTSRVDSLLDSHLPYQIGGFTDHIDKSQCSEFIADAVSLSPAEGAHAMSAPASTMYCGVWTNYVDNTGCTAGYTWNGVTYGSNMANCTCTYWLYPPNTVGHMVNDLWHMLYNQVLDTVHLGFWGQIGSFFIGCGVYDAALNIANIVTNHFMDRAWRGNDWYSYSIHDVNGVSSPTLMAPYLSANPNYVGRPIREYPGHYECTYTPPPTGTCEAEGYGGCSCLTDCASCCSGIAAY
jgi:hypothetical protein